MKPTNPGGNNKTNNHERNNKMKTTNLWKKAITLTLALALVAGLAVGTGLTASAAGDGKITVHKYARPTAGIVTSNTYTGDELTDAALLASLGKPLPGAGFTLYKLNTNALNTAIADGNKYVSHEINTDNSVTFTLDGAGEPAETTVTAVPTVVGSEQTTNADGETVFDNLDDAYYLLMETTTPTGYTPSEKSVIRIPLTQADGEAHNRNIHVYPKNVSDDFPVRKEIDGKPVVLNAGDDIIFNIIADFRNGDDVANVGDMKDGSDYGQAFVVDKIEKYFNYVSVVSVTLLDAAGNQIGAPLTAGTEYRIITSMLNDGYGDLAVALTEAGIEKAVVAGAASYVVKVKLNYLGAQGFVGNIPAEVKNTAKSLIAGPDADPVEPDDPDIPELPTAEVNVPTTQIVLEKTFNDLSTPAGVKFRLSKVAVPTGDSDYVTDINGDIIELTTDASGILVFNGVDYDEEDGKTYYLHEIKTKEGYQLKVGTIAVTLLPKDDASNESQLDDEGDWVNGALVQTIVAVVNYKNGDIDPEEPAFSLPLTGGAGTIILSIVGVLTMAGASVWFIRRKKKENA